MVLVRFRGRVVFWGVVSLSVRWEAGFIIFLRGVVLVRFRFGWGHILRGRGLSKCLMEGGDKMFMSTGMAGGGAMDFTLVGRSLCVYFVSVRVFF